MAMQNAKPARQNLRDINALIDDVRHELERSAPELLPLFSTMSQEARFGRNWIDKDLKSLKPGAKILEVGGGIFLLSCQLSHEGYDITTIEPSGSGFGEFQALGEKILGVSKRHGALPHILTCSAEDFASNDVFDYAFSINVMEHVDDPEKVIHKITRALSTGSSYRFVCPNYLFPYDPHFNIPTLLNKNITGAIFSRKIARNKRMQDPSGVWKSINWITAPMVKRLTGRDNGLSLFFDKNTLVWMLERGMDDPEFIRRRSGWMIRLVKAAKKYGVLNLARHVPAAIQPIMDCRLTKSTKHPSQITTGIRSILSLPSVYESFQNLLGAKQGRTILAQRYIKAFSGMKILDIGCGTGSILEFLPSQITYHGYDIREKYIAHAQARFGNRGVFTCRIFDAAEAKKLPKFDLVMALGVLHHLSDTEANDFITLARSALKPGGRLLTRDPCLAEGQNPLARFLISHDRGQHVRNAQGYHALAERHFSTIKGELTHQSWVPYTHWTMEAS